MKKRFAMLGLALLCAVTMTTGQNRRSDAHLTGHVIDAQTREHIPFATITIKGTTVGTATDATGHFLMTNLPPGEYTVVASYIGYQSEEMVVQFERNKTVEVKFDLEPKSLEINTVVVTGSRNETNKKESSSIVNVLSTRLFETAVAASPADALNFQSGLRVEQTCSNCGVPQLRINGLEGQYSQILLDSRPIFSSLATVYGLEQMPVGMIERIEVIRGGGSALFGSNAIGGVVNIITKEPLRNTLTLSNNTGVTDLGTKDVTTTLNGAFVTDSQKLGVYLFGMMRDRDAYDRNGDGFSDVPMIGSETIGFRSFYKLSPLSKLTLEYHHIREFRRGGDQLNRPPHEANIAEQLRHQINGGGLKYDYLSPNYKHKISLYTSLQGIDRDSYFGTAQNLDAYGQTTDKMFVGGSQYTYSADRLIFMPSQLTLGVEYQDNTLEDEMLGYNRVINQRSICYGTYFQNEWKNEQWGILLGGRLDKHNKVENPIFVPRVNVRYSPLSAVGFRASYSSGYRAPQAYDEDLHVAAVGGSVAIITLDPNLKPEYSNSVSGSVDLYHDFGGVETNLLVEGFYTDIRDVFTLEPNGIDGDGNLLWERRNGPGAVVKGVNLEAKVGWSARLVLDAGYTFQRSLYEEPLVWSENPDKEPVKQLLRAPDQYGYLTVNYLPVRQLTLSLTGTYTGTMLVPHFGGEDFANDWMKQTPSFFDMGLRVAYDFQLSAQTKLQVSGGVKNVFDQFQNDLGVGMYQDAGYIYGPAMPRMYHIGLRLTM